MKIILNVSKFNKFDNKYLFISPFKNQHSIKMKNHPLRATEMLDNKMLVASKLKVLMEKCLKQSSKISKIACKILIFQDLIFRT
jgi:hypothetical protein